MFALTVCAFVASVSGFAVEGPTNPVTRVATLLQDLSKKVEKDGKAEEKLFKKFKCWYTNVEEKKTKAVSDAAARIQELIGLIDDLASGRTVLTSERTDLENQLVAVRADIAAAAAQREKEKSEFEDSQDEMNQAIAALEKTLGLLKSATKTSLLSGLTGEAAMIRERAFQKEVLVSKFSLRDVLRAGQGLLSASQVREMENWLDVAEPVPELDLPKIDWKKVNRDSPAAKKYEAGSGKIQSTMKEMLATFQKEFTEIIKSESDAIASYDSLSKAKADQAAAILAGLDAGSLENASKAKKLSTYKKEKKALEERMAADQKLLVDSSDLFNLRSKEFEDRLRLRGEEVASINKAIGIIRSDDARDLFSKNFHRKDANAFIQKMLTTRQISGVVKRAAELTKLRSLATLAFQMKYLDPAEISGSDPFVVVKDSLRNRIADLMNEEKSDVDRKLWCQSETASSDFQAKQLGRAIESATDSITRKAEREKEVNASQTLLNQQASDIMTSRATAEKNRAQENAEYQSVRQDDQAAVVLLEQAAEVLKAFYSSNRLTGETLLAKGQRASAVGPYVSHVEGQDVAPPPTMWKGAYGGASGETSGVVAILDLLKEDMKNDIADADANEAKSNAEYAKFVVDSQNDIDDLSKELTVFAQEKADLESGKALAASERSESQGQLTATLEYLKGIAPGCDFLLAEFDTRITARQGEVRGLNKALEILSGADLDKYAKDESREIRPGDAL